MPHKDPAVRRAYLARWRRAHRKRRPDLHAAREQRHAAKCRLLVDSLKARPCADCGVQYPPHVMQFDHRDPAAKAFGIGTAYRGRSAEAIQAEAAKCDVVCANCHAARTHRRRRAA